VQKYSWVHYNLKHYVGNDMLDEDKFEIIGNIYDKEDEQMELNQCNDCKEIKKLKDELESLNTNCIILSENIEKLMNNMSLSPDELREIIRE